MIWYDTITGGHLWAASIANIRHFTGVAPLPGATALCGEVAGDDCDGDVGTTCESCAMSAASIRVVPQPLPEPPAAPDPPSALEVVAGLIGALGGNDKLAVIAVAEGLANGTISPGDLA